MSLATDTVKTYTVKNGTSTASLSVVRTGDGSFVFTDADGNKRVIKSEPDMIRLMEAIDALV